MPTLEKVFLPLFALAVSVFVWLYSKKVRQKWVSVNPYFMASVVLLAYLAGVLIAYMAEVLNEAYLLKFGSYLYYYLPGSYYLVPYYVVPRLPLVLIIFFLVWYIVLLKKRYSHLSSSSQNVPLPPYNWTRWLAIVFFILFFLNTLWHTTYGVFGYHRRVLWFLPRPQQAPSLFMRSYYEQRDPSLVQSITPPLDVVSTSTGVAAQISDEMTIYGKYDMAKCEDSDRVNNIFVKGHVTSTNANGVETTVYDECTSSKLQVNETWCNKNPAGGNTYMLWWRAYNCPNGCLDGACLK